MKRIDILFINKIFNSSDLESLKIDSDKETIKISLNVEHILNYDLGVQLKKIDNLVRVHDKIKRINIIFDKDIDDTNINRILTKLNDLLYSYYPKTKEIKLYQVSDESNNLMNELFKYKDIVMDPNKNPNTYLSYVKSRIPNKYNIKVFDTNNIDKELFPFTRAVGLGSSYGSYFVHIYPSKEKDNNKTLFLVGKAVTFDSGGLNLKTSNMEEMKVDMTGSAILMSLLNLLVQNNIDSRFNVHLIFPIVENMISSTALKPGMVVKSMSEKTVEVLNTDAEGRLCFVDAFDYVNLVLMRNRNPGDCLLLDIATLTGNTYHITSGISSLAMCNTKALNYLDDLIYIGEEIGEYVDFLKVRKEYLDMLKSTVADIKNIDLSVKAGCIIAGTFLSYFINDAIPWIHVDVGVSTFVEGKPLSYGVNLLYEFIKRL